MGELLWPDTENSRNWSFYISLQVMADCIIGEIDSTIWERLNKVLFVKRELSSQPKRSWASPFLQPPDSIHQIVMKDFTICFECLFNMIENSFLPVLISIVDVPLIAEANNAGIPASWNNISSRLVVYQGITPIYQLFSHQAFCIQYFTSFVVTDNHDSLVETFLVWLILCLLKELLIVLTFYFVLFAQSNSNQITVSWCLDERNGLQVHHLFSNVVLLPQCFFVSQVRGSHPIIRGITRNTCYNSSTFFHRDSHHGKDIDNLMHCIRSR